MIEYPEDATAMISPTTLRPNSHANIARVEDSRLRIDGDV
jgi:hypothetical protein